MRVRKRDVTGNIYRGKSHNHSSDGVTNEDLVDSFRFQFGSRCHAAATAAPLSKLCQSLEYVFGWPFCRWWKVERLYVRRIDIPRDKQFQTMPTYNKFYENEMCWDGCLHWYKSCLCAATCTAQVELKIGLERSTSKYAVFQMFKRVVKSRWCETGVRHLLQTLNLKG